MFAQSRTPAGYVTVTCLFCDDRHTGTAHTARTFKRDHDCPRRVAA